VSSHGSKYAIQLEALSAGYSGSQALSNINISVERGETFSLLGPSGCGKTTLLRCIAGLHRPDSGQIRLFSETVFAADTFVEPEWRKVGMVFQDGALFPHLSVRKNLEFGLRNFADKESRVSRYLELVDMAEYADRLPDSLSGGQQQRIALARALAPSPGILLLDEPFSALDTELRVAIRREVKDILKEVGATTVLVTHDQDEAYLLGDRVAVLDRGEIRQIGTPVEIYESPADPWVASFAGDANLLEGTFSGKCVDTVFGELPAGHKLAKSEMPPGGRLQVVIRPEHLSLSEGGVANVIMKQYFGHDVLYTVDIAGLLSVNVRSTSNQFNLNDKVKVDFIGEAVSGWPI
jgi:iron(III) transport system ATP-binding protein